MAFNPSSYTFTYLKFSNLETPASFTKQFGATLPSEFTFLGVPAWLTVYNAFLNDVTGVLQFNIKPNAAAANNLIPNSYQVTIVVKFKINGNWSVPVPGNLNISLQVIDNVLLALVPTNLSFNHVVAAPLPTDQILQITAESPWTIVSDQSWATPSVANGIGSAQVLINVDPTALAVGNYTATFTVSNVLEVKLLVVSLQVSEENTPTNYVYLSPVNFDLIAQFEDPTPITADLALDVSHNWTAVSNQSWLTPSATSGVAGSFVIVLTADGSALALGNHFAEIIFTGNNITKKIFIIFRIVTPQTEGILSDTLYYAEDRNAFKSTDLDNNAFLVLDVQASNGLDNEVYKQDAPYFRGSASIVLGSETKVLLKSVVPTNNFLSTIKNNIAPINLNITAFNENKFDGSLVQLMQLQNVLFLNGKSPVTPKKLSYMPSQITVTKDAVISLSVQADNPPNEIVITGDVNTTIGASPPSGKNVYNAIINLADFTLVAGNTLNIVFEGLSINVVIKPTEPEQTLIAFENEWNEYEFFEATGTLTITPTAKKTTTQVLKDGIKTTKVVSIDSGADYTLDTGWIFSQAEADWLIKILDADHIFIYHNNMRIEVELISKKLPQYKTRQHLISYNLKFKKVEI